MTKKQCDKPECHKLPWQFRLFEAVVWSIFVGLVVSMFFMSSARASDCEARLYASPQGQIFTKRVTGTWVNPIYEPAERSANAANAALEFEDSKETRAFAARVFPKIETPAVRKLAWIERADFNFLKIKADAEAAAFLSQLRRTCGRHT